MNMAEWYVAGMARMKVMRMPTMMAARNKGRRRLNASLAPTILTMMESGIFSTLKNVHTRVLEGDVAAEQDECDGHAQVVEGEEVDEEVAVAEALVPPQVDVVLDEERGDEDAVEQVHQANQ